MKPLKAQPSDRFRRTLCLPAVLLVAVLMSWGFTPHKRLHAVEWMLGQDQMRHCPPCDIHEMRYDPVWTPWGIVAESHALAPDVFRAEKTWTALHGMKGYGFRKRGRTLHLVPTKESLATWDSLTHHHTWPRFCLAAQRIASAWHAAWIDVGKPRFTPPLSSPRDESTKLQFTPRRKERLKRENPSPS